jgi:3-oxoacyl-[acyl-carrier protein] reductase
MARLNGKTAIITGGARGIGLATATRMVAEGAEVALCDREGAEEAARALGPRALGFALDVTDAAQVDATVQLLMEKWGKIDVLVNNAGITRDATLLKTSERAWEDVLAVNLTGTFVMTQKVAPHMVARKSGVILNAASIVGIYGNFGQSNYVATKAAVIGLTRVWARELGRKGIRVNCIAPGFIATDMTSAMPKEVLTGMEQRTPLGRLGAPADVAATYAFLASDDAAFVNGQVLGVDGGLVLGT